MSQDLPPLTALRAFEAAARLLSVSKAGDELHVTHGAISRQIRALEEELGVRLVSKEGRGIKLTDAGVRLRDTAGETFERLRLVCADLKRQTQDAPFVLGCPGSLLARWFIPRLDRLNRELPELRLQLSTSHGELDPRSPQVDATLLFAEPPWPADMQVFELAAERIGPVLSPRYARFAELHQAPSPRSNWWPTTWRPVAWSRPGASSKPRRAWRCGNRYATATRAPRSWRLGWPANWAILPGLRPSISLCAPSHPPDGRAHGVTRMKESRDYLEMAFRSIQCFADDGKLLVHELESLVDIARRDGVVDGNEKRILQGIIERLNPVELTEAMQAKIAELRSELQF